MIQTRTHLSAKIKKFMRLSAADRLLLLKAAILLLSLRLLLCLSPAHRASALVQQFLKRPSRSHKDFPRFTQRVVWAVETMGNYLLSSRCLPQALAVRILLNRNRIRTRLVIGFISGPLKRSAHAWVVADDDVIIGNNPLIPFYLSVPMPHDE